MNGKIIFIFAIALSTNAVATTKYVVTALPALPGSDPNSATAINDLGAVVGEADISGVQASVKWTKTTVENLNINDTLGQQISSPNSINNAGVIVGGSFIAGPFGGIGFEYKDGQLTLLPEFIEANAINASGAVAGDGIGRNGHQTALLLSNSKTQELGTLGGTNSRALGMNDIGTIVGDSHLAQAVGNDPNNIVRAFIWNNGVMSQIDPLPGDTLSQANAVNNGNQVIGISLNLGQYGVASFDLHSFIYSSGIIKEIPALQGQHLTSAKDINDMGQVVGSSDTNTPGIPVNNSGFIYQDGISTDLNSLLVGTSTDWHIVGAAGINNQGQIAATGFNINDSTETRRAVLLTPIPLPLPILLFASGFLLLVTISIICKTEF